MNYVLGIHIDSGTFTECQLARVASRKFIVDMDATFVILLTFLCINQVCKHNYVIIARLAASANDEIILISENTKAEVALFQHIAKQSRICILVNVVLLIKRNIIFTYIGPHL